MNRDALATAGSYWAVVLIWSTTPLAIKWSGEGSGFLFGVLGRMVVGTALCLLLARLLRVPVPISRAALTTYGAAAVGIYGSMLCAYWAAQYVPSGLIAVIFGLTPLIAGVFAVIHLGEPALSPARILGSLLSLLGLALIFGDVPRLGPAAVGGILGLLGAVTLHSLSLVWVKRTRGRLDALAVATGGLLLALPLYVVTWLVLDGALPAAVPPRTAASIIYLGLIGSGLGFILYYYSLGRLPAFRIALIPLITPVAATAIGHLANQEQPGTGQLAGTALILVGILSHEFGGRIRRIGGRRSGGPPPESAQR